jgi:hypothetical protein
MLVAETVNVFAIMLSCERMISVRNSPLVGLIASGWI